MELGDTNNCMYVCLDTLSCEIMEEYKLGFDFFHPFFVTSPYKDGFVSLVRPFELPKHEVE